MLQVNDLGPKLRRQHKSTCRIRGYKFYPGLWLDRFNVVYILGCDFHMQHKIIRVIHFIYTFTNFLLHDLKILYNFGKMFINQHKMLYTFKIFRVFFIEENKIAIINIGDVITLKYE